MSPSPFSPRRPSRLLLGKPWKPRRRGRWHAQRDRGAGWGMFLAGVAAILLVAAGGLFYIAQVTSSAVGGYDVSSLEERVNALREEQRRLELDAADLQSLRAVEEGVQHLNFVPTYQAVFTSPIVSGAVAFSPP